MAYSVYTDIQSEFTKLDLSSTTKITDAEVTEFIAQADAVIDGKLSKKYSVPIVSVAALPIIKQISIWLVAGRVWNVLNTVSDTTKDRGKELMDKAKSMIMGILAEGDKEIILSGAVLVRETTIVASNYNNEIEPIFEKETEQW